MISNVVYRILVECVFIVIGIIISGVLSDAVCRYFHQNQVEENEYDGLVKDEAEIISKTTYEFLILLVIIIAYVDFVPNVFGNLFSDNIYIMYPIYFIFTTLAMIFVIAVVKYVVNLFYCEK